MRITFFLIQSVFFLFIIFHAGLTLSADYIIGSGDVLTVTVYDHEELTTKVRVSDQGNITFPLIGAVQVGSLKIPAAAEEIRIRLADGYIITPQVNIFIDQFRSKKVTVLGQVMQPGLIELHGSTTLLELISKVGGLQDGAGETVSIKREQDGRRKTITVDLYNLLEVGDASQNIQIKGGDTVSVPKAWVCYITGEITKPGPYPCGRKTTVLNVVSLAGGLTGIASESGIKIHRIVDGKKIVIKKVVYNTPVLPDDIIVIPESFF